MKIMYCHPQAGEYTEDYKRFLGLRFAIYRDSNCLWLLQANERFMRTRLEVREAIKDPKVRNQALKLMELDQKTKVIKTLNEKNSRLAPVLQGDN